MRSMRQSSPSHASVAVSSNRCAGAAPPRSFALIVATTTRSPRWRSATSRSREAVVLRDESVLIERRAVARARASRTRTASARLRSAGRSAPSPFRDRGSRARARGAARPALRCRPRASTTLAARCSRRRRRARSPPRPSRPGARAWYGDWPECDLDLRGAPSKSARMQRSLVAALCAALVGLSACAGRAADVAAPSRCDAAVNARLAQLIAEQHAGAVDNVMVCGTTIAASRSRHGSRADHELIPLRVPLATGSALVEVVTERRLDGHVTAPRGARVVGYGQYFLDQRTAAAVRCRHPRDALRDAPRRGQRLGGRQRDAVPAAPLLIPAARRDSTYAHADSSVARRP